MSGSGIFGCRSFADTVASTGAYPQENDGLIGSDLLQFFTVDLNMPPESNLSSAESDVEAIRVFVRRVVVIIVALGALFCAGERPLHQLDRRLKVGFDKRAAFRTFALSCGVAKLDTEFADVERMSRSQSWPGHRLQVQPIPAPSRS